LKISSLQQNAVEVALRSARGKTRQNSVAAAPLNINLDSVESPSIVFYHKNKACNNSALVSAHSEKNASIYTQNKPA